MFSRKYHLIMSKFSLLVMIFAALAPTISYALSAHSNPQFFQQICSSSANNTSGNIKKVTLQIATTQGNQQLTTLSIKQSLPVPVNMTIHFEHCPFCASHVDVIAPPNLSNALFVAELNAYQLQPSYAAPSSKRIELRANPHQAPPYLSYY